MRGACVADRSGPKREKPQGSRSPLGVFSVPFLTAFRPPVRQSAYLAVCGSRCEPRSAPVPSGPSPAEACDGEACAPDTRGCHLPAGPFPDLRTVAGSETVSWAGSGLTRSRRLRLASSASWRRPPSGPPAVVRRLTVLVPACASRSFLTTPTSGCPSVA